MSGDRPRRLSTPKPVRSSPGHSSTKRASMARDRAASPTRIQTRSATKRSRALDIRPDKVPHSHLQPASSIPATDSYWRSFSPSRSPSPLGLIPIHQSWRTVVHKHEVPRKVLHVSIGFFTLYLYTRGVSAAEIHPWLLTALVPIASVDVLRHTLPSVNHFYVRTLGLLMRESEVDGYNGVIWYLLGSWSVLRFLPKDVGVVSILLLSWCDTAASTVGRMYGRYTPLLTKGKSLAGSAAALLVGIMTASLFWGFIVPSYSAENLQFRGVLGWSGQSISGWFAIGIVSLWSGIMASASEAIDLWGLDDNATIPILSGIGLWGFLKLFAR